MITTIIVFVVVVIIVNFSSLNFPQETYFDKTKKPDYTPKRQSTLFLGKFSSQMLTLYFIHIVYPISLLWGPVYMEVGDPRQMRWPASVGYPACPNNLSF